MIAAPPPTIAVRLLGPITVLVEGRTVPVPGRGERALLARLATSTDAVVSTERLVEDLWETELPRDPRNALQLRASKLRRIVGPALVTRPPGYLLDREAVDIDVHRFEDLIDTRQFEAALAMWHGAPLEELADHEWAMATATRLLELRATALDEHLDARLAAGDHLELVGELATFVAADPLREHRREQLMLALHRSGRDAEALATYQDVRRRLRDELGISPSPSIRRLEIAILRDEPGASIEPVRPNHTLPAPLDPLIGRRQELDELGTVVGRERLVTLVGPGGVGKTRLAVEIGGLRRDEHTHGCWFVALATVDRAEDVPTAVADALGLAAPDAAPERVALAWLASRDVLLVLDNCEHLADAVAAFIGRATRAAPRLRILATGRRPLGLAGEVRIPVHPLGLDDAAALFVERAARARPRLRLVADDPTVRRVCATLDGLPLAVELAAARVGTLTVAAIDGLLDDRFALLAGGSGTTDRRHHALRAVIDWSYDLLDDDGREMLTALSVFRGGFDLAGASTVTTIGAPTLDVLGQLVDHFLVIVADDGRFDMLETIRAYAAERLAADFDAVAAGERHARHLVGLARSCAAELRGPGQRQALATMRQEDANLHVAMAWSIGRSHTDPDLALELAAALGWYWYVGRQSEGREVIVLALDRGAHGSPGALAGAWEALSLVSRPGGCIVHASSAAAAAAASGLRLRDASGDEEPAALDRLFLAVEGVIADDPAPQLGAVADARAVLARHGSEWGVALADFIEMELWIHHGAIDAALAAGDRATAAFDALDDAWGRSAVRLHLGYGLRLAGRLDDARRVLRTSVSISDAVGLPNNLARAMVELGETVRLQGDQEEAHRWFTVAEQAAADVGQDALRAMAFVGIGDVARSAGDGDAARASYDRAIHLADAEEWPEVVRRANEGLAGLAAGDATSGIT